MRERAVELCGRIEESDLDVVSFQEVWTGRALAVLRRLLPSYGFVAYRRGGVGQPAGGLVTFSRLPIGTVSYSSFRGARPGAGGPVFRTSRAVNTRLQGVLTVELAGLATVLGNVHLSANHDGDWSPGNRHYGLHETQLAMLHEALRRARDRTGAQLAILSGDFNVASQSPLYPLVVDGGAWRDPFAATDPPTYHVEFLPPGGSAQRIDYLLVSGDAERYPVTRTALLFAEPVAPPGGRRMFLSDHVALTARVALPDAGRVVCQ
jgi:hypothetical protein